MRGKVSFGLFIIFGITLSVFCLLYALDVTDINFYASIACVALLASAYVIGRNNPTHSRALRGLSLSEKEKRDNAE